MCFPCLHRTMFDEGRFDDPDDDDDGRLDEGGDSSSKSRGGMRDQVVQAEGDVQISHVGAS